MKGELVGTVVKNESVIRIFRQLDPVAGFQYFLEKDGELKLFDAFGEREYEFRMPYPVVLDRWLDRNVWPAVRSVDLKVYHIEDNDLDAKIGGQELGAWWEKALAYYKSYDDLGFWKEYWGLLKDERETLFYFFEKLFKENVLKDWQEWAEFHGRILNVSLGEYRGKLIDHFIEHMSYVLECNLKMPKNKAKGLFVWLTTHEAHNWEWDTTSIMGIALNGLFEWDYLTADEREAMSIAIYERLKELAKKEEKWAGLSLEDWVELLKKKLVKDGVIKDTDTFWKWIRQKIKKEDMYDLLCWAFEEKVDWVWMPRKERKELAKAMEEFIIEKLEAENKCV
jgi:hypothetical protein